MWKHPIEYNDDYYDYYGVARNISSDYIFDLGPDTTKQIEYYYPALTAPYYFAHASHCGNVNWVSFYNEDKESRDMFLKMGESEKLRIAWSWYQNLLMELVLKTD